MSRELHRAARQFADQQTRRLGEIPVTQTFFARVTSLSPLKVTWRGGEVPVVAHAASYTPGLNDWVKCSLPDNQVYIDSQSIPA